MEKYGELDYAKLDFDRGKRTGYPETIFCQGKTIAQLRGIFRAFWDEKINVLGTRASREQYENLKEEFPEMEYRETASVLILQREKVCGRGRVAVCTGGTADIPVAEEAAVTAEFFGCEVDRIYDVGVAVIHRLLAQEERLQKAGCVIAVAGMEGALGSVVAGLVRCPVIGVPTSVGYGSSFHGFSALLTMLNSCAEGLAVVNIDNGFGAGYMAAQMNRMILEGGKK